jgi:GNAT superfamily N-acetyltransferase
MIHTTQTEYSRADIQIETVASPRSLREFVTFPFTRYRDDSLWVPPLIEERLDFLNPRKNPFFEHAQVALFLARRGGAVVGTVSAAIDANYAAFHGERMATFGFFETIDDPQVAAQLLAAAEAYAREHGATVMRGPISFSTNHELGLLIEGFDTSPMVMMTYNPPAYAALIEGCGYRKAIDLLAYIGDLGERWENADRGIVRVAQKAARKAGIHVRPANIRHFDEEVQRIKSIYQRAWVRNWGFVPLTEKEADYLAASLKPVIDPSLVLIAETDDGTPVGMSIALPDLHQALRWSGGGPMFPFGLLKFLWYRRRINQFRLWGMGVIEEYRGQGIDAVFYVETTRAALAKGYRCAEASWVLETNTMMIRILEHLGLQRYKTYRVYEKQL